MISQREDSESKRIAFGGALGRFMLDSTIPGAGALMEVVKKAVDYGHVLRDGLAAERLKKFHEWIVYDDDHDAPTPEQFDDISANDFKAVLNALLNDIEEEKAQLYAQLVRAQATRRIPKGFLRPITLALKSLPAYQIEAMRLAYIVEVGPVLRASQYAPQRGIKQPADSAPQYPGYQELVAQGLVRDEKLTQFGTQFVKAVYPPNDLSPESAGMVRKIGKCHLVLDGVAGWSENFAHTLTQSLVTAGVEIGAMIYGSGIQPHRISHVSMQLLDGIVVFIYGEEGSREDAAGPLADALKARPNFHAAAGRWLVSDSGGATASNYLDQLGMLPLQEAVERVKVRLVEQIKLKHASRPL